MSNYEVNIVDPDQMAQVLADLDLNWSRDKRRIYGGKG
jgi:hypothetical protein